MFGGVLDNEVFYWQDKYAEKFGDYLPLAMFDGNKKELIVEIKKCIKENKQYDTSYWNEHPDEDT